MKLSNGFEIQIDEAALHDWDFVEAVCDVDRGNTTAMPAMFTAMLGEKQKKALVAHIRATTGTCTVEQMSDALVEIFNALKEPEKK